MYSDTLGSNFCFDPFLLNFQCELLDAYSNSAGLHVTFHSFHWYIASLKTIKLSKSKREMLEGGLSSSNYKVNWQWSHTETHPSPHVLIG